MTTTIAASMHWSKPLKVQVEWKDYHLQETIESIMRGISEASRGEGRLLDDSDLATDDDD